MLRKAVITALSILLLTGIISTIHAEEELFDTKTATVHLEKGLEYLKAKKFDSAISEFEESALIYPDAEAFYYLGYAYYMKGKNQDGEYREKAMENFEKAYEINPGFTPTKFKPVEPVPAVTEPKQETAKEQPQQPSETQPATTNQPQGQTGEQTPPSPPPATQPAEQPPH